ncbi:MAG: metallophosphoesterase [Acidobacteria bacterium]|nr:metallophosphoesterase [Acidobacteriota bacterium]
MKQNVLTRLRNRRTHRPLLRQQLRALVTTAAIEAHHFEVTRFPIRLSKLPRAFDGLKLAQLSDIHHSPFLSEAEILQAVHYTNALQPDLIALTGDYISHSPEYIPGVTRALGELRAPLGVFAILGNHDHWTDGERMAAALRDAGITVLINEHVTVHHQDAHIKLLGIDDMVVKRDDLAAALVGTTEDETRILLSHNPAIIREAARAKIDLVLSGHTHGGQINWRLLTGRPERRRWLQRRSRRLLRGYAAVDDTQIYVNRGLGTVVVPLRYGCSPEITLMELQAT